MTFRDRNSQPRTSISRTSASKSSKNQTSRSCEKYYFMHLLYKLIFFRFRQKFHVLFTGSSVVNSNPTAVF
jgi:hypothetical protein